MTDWDLEWRAGEAIGLKLVGVQGRDAFMWEEETANIWMPLWSDVHAMRLVRSLGLCIAHRVPQQAAKRPEWIVQNDTYSELVENVDLNRAIVECAALLKR